MLGILTRLLGPMFAKEAVEMSRRKRYYFARVLYGLVLLATMFVVWSEYAYLFHYRQTLDVMADVVARMVEDGPSEEELESAKRYLIGAYPINNLDSSTAVARTLVELQRNRLGIDYIEAGWPGANATDDATFAARPALGSARLAAPQATVGK